MYLNNFMFLDQFPFEVSCKHTHTHARARARARARVHKHTHTKTHGNTHIHTDALKDSDEYSIVMGHFPR